VHKCPDDYISRWFSVLHRLFLSYIYDNLQDLNIGSRQIMFLVELYHQDGISQEELSRYLNIDEANTARAIKKLEQEGYVKRIKDPEDKRAYKLYLTEKALAAQSRIFTLISSWEEQLLQNLSREERIVLTGLIKRVGHTVADNLRCAECTQKCL